MYKKIDSYRRKNCAGKYIYMLLLFLWCAYTAPFLKPFDTQYLFSSFIYVTIYLCYYIKFRLRKDHKPLIILLILFGTWYVAQCIKVSSVTLIDFRLLYSIILCDISFYLYKGKEFFVYFEKVLFHLTLLSLVVWGLGVIIPEIMRSIFDVISVWSNGNTTYGNAIIVALGDQHSMGILRNIGFTWEAGRFSSFLVVGMFFSLLLHKMRTKGNYYFIVFLAGLISTVSTTGVVSCIGVFILYLMNKRFRLKIYIITILLFLILFLPYLWSMDFIGGKILENADVNQEIHNMSVSFENNRGSAITPQRITGLYLEFLNLMNDFWLGYNLNKNSYTVSLFGGEETWLSNGVILILSKYGILLGSVFYFLLFKSSKKLITDFGHKGSYLFALTFMLINVSYDFWSSGIFMHMVLYWLYCKYDTKLSVSNHNKYLLNNVLFKYLNNYSNLQFRKKYSHMP